MTGYMKKFKWLQQLSKVKIDAAIRHKLEYDVYYPDPFTEPDEWYKITVENHLGEKKVLTLLNRKGKRNDSYYLAMEGIQIFFNRFGNLVLNQTRWPLIMGFSDAMRFMAKQFPKISGRHNE